MKGKQVIMRRHFLFIVTSFWAFGELQIASDFASELIRLGAKVLFLIPPSHVRKIRTQSIPYRTLIPQGVTINRIILRDIEESFSPDYIILSDFLNYSFCHKHYGLTLSDLSVFSGSIGAFDLYNFASTRGKIDTYGFRAKEMSQLSLSDYAFLLQPCPVNIPALSEVNNNLRYRLFNSVSCRSEADIARSRDSLKMKPSEKLIVMTGAVWQSSFRPYANVHKMVSAIDGVIIQMLQNLPDYVKTLWIGPRRTDMPKGMPQIQQVDSLSQQEFESCVDGADVFISMNYISTSMIRAALRGVPVVLLGNSFLKRAGESRYVTSRNPEPDILRDIDDVYPFRMFPVGWYSFLEPVVNGNPFYRLTKRAEVFDIQSVYETIEEAICETYGKTVENLAAFRAKWLELPSIEHIVISLCN